MKTETFIQILSDEANRNMVRFESLRNLVPLGVDGDGKIVTAHKEEKKDRYHTVCVSGEMRTDYIKRLAMWLGCIYDKNETCFLVLSPNREYGKLLEFMDADFTVPYVNEKEDVTLAVSAISQYISASGLQGKSKKLVVIADGLETLTKGNSFTGDVSDGYMEILNAVGKAEVEVIIGMPLEKSRFSGYPGAFIGIGNALLTVEEEGKAFAMHVNPDCSLSVPTQITFPADETLQEIVNFFNQIA